MNDNNNTFIGMGTNPDPNVPDIPLGLGMQLAQNPKAHSAFGRMSDDEKTQIIDYVQGSQTGEDAQNRIADVVERLSR